VAIEFIHYDPLGDTFSHVIAFGSFGIGHFFQVFFPQSRKVKRFFYVKKWKVKLFFSSFWCACLFGRKKSCKRLVIWNFQRLLQNYIHLGSAWILGKIEERKARERKWVDTVTFHSLATHKKDEERKFWGGTHAQNLNLSTHPWTETCKRHQLIEKKSKITLLYY